MTHRISATDRVTTLVTSDVASPRAVVRAPQDSYLRIDGADAGLGSGAVIGLPVAAVAFLAAAIAPSYVPAGFGPFSVMAGAFLSSMTLGGLLGTLFPRAAVRFHVDTLGAEPGTSR